jgi:hypothetical protein
VQADGKPQTIDDTDYLVLAFEYRKSLVDDVLGEAADLPFHEAWETVQEKLASEDVEGATQAFRQLAVRVAASPDLVQADRIKMMATYRAHAEAWQTAKVGRMTRAARAGGPDDIITSLNNVAGDRSLNLSKQASTVLSAVSNAISGVADDDSIAKDAAAPAGLAATAKRIGAELSLDGIPVEERDVAATHLLSVLLNDRL